MIQSNSGWERDLLFGRRPHSVDLAPLGKLQNALLADYRIVREPGPHVMRLTVALTEAEASNTVLDTIPSVLPTGYLLSGTKSLATGTGTFVGSASVEAKMTDAELGTHLAAAVDRRGGTNLWRESLQNGMTSKSHFNTGPLPFAIACANGATNTIVWNPSNRKGIGVDKEQGIAPW